MKKYKKLLALLLAAAMLAGMMATTAFATEGDAPEEPVTQDITDVVDSQDDQDGQDDQDNQDNQDDLDNLDNQDNQDDQVPPENPVVNVEEVPAEVQAFLKAVAALPGAEEVTPENAEEIGYQVNAVLDMWDTMSAENGEREDVTEALETVYAVYEAVLAAEEIDEGTTYEASSIRKSAFENAYNLGQLDTCYGIVNLGEGSVIDSGTPNVWPTGGWEGSVNVTGYNWVHIYNTNPSVATATYRYDGGKLFITFKPGTSSGTTKISVDVDAKYSHPVLGTWDMELTFDYTVTNGSSSVTDTQLYSETRSVTYDLGTDKAVWGKNPYNGQYGERPYIEQFSK